MPLWKDPKTGKYRYQFQYRGQRYSRTGFDSQKAAKAAMAKHRGDLEQPQNLTPPSPSTPSALGSRTLSLMELMVKHLRLAERELIPSTVSYRSTVFRRFHAHIKKYHGEIPAAAITKDMVEEYLLTRPTNHNFNKERRELMRLFTWAIDGELLVKNPVLRVRKLAVSKEKKEDSHLERDGQDSHGGWQGPAFPPGAFPHHGPGGGDFATSMGGRQFPGAGHSALDPETEGGQPGVRLAPHE